jgi:hypothetical protein
MGLMLCGFSQQNAKFRSGSKTLLSLTVSDIQKITFANDGINIFTDGGVMFLPFSSVSNIVFSDEEITIEDDGTITVDITAESLSESVNIWYSPSVERVFIKSPTPLGNVNIYDIQGKIIRTAKPTGQEAEISLSSLPSGLYIVVSENGQGLITGKIMK